MTAAANFAAAQTKGEEMKLFVNGEEVGFSLENEKTAGDVLRAFEEDCERNDCAVTGIAINGEKIGADEFDGAAAKPLDKCEKFEFDVVSRADAAELFKSLAPKFDDLARKLEDVGVDLQSGRGAEAAASITALADCVSLFCRAAATAALFPAAYNDVPIDGKPFAEFFAEFTPILSDFEGAMKDGDIVLVGDLAEYEICPRVKAMRLALEALNGRA